MKCMDVHSLPAAEVRDKTVYNRKERDENKEKKKKTNHTTLCRLGAAGVRGEPAWLGRLEAVCCGLRPGGLHRPTRIATAYGASSETRRLQGRSSFKRQ